MSTTTKVDPATYTHTMTRDRLDRLEQAVQQLGEFATAVRAGQVGAQAQAIVNPEKLDLIARTLEDLNGSSSIDPGTILALLLELVRIIRGR